MKGSGQTVFCLEPFNIVDAVHAKPGDMLKLPHWLRSRSEFAWETFLASQLQALSDGAEIAPPWVAYPDEDPWWGGWRQGAGEWWLINIWHPYWKQLSGRQRVEYVDRWEATTVWREYLLLKWSKGGLKIPLGDTPISSETADINYLELAVFGMSDAPAVQRWYVHLAHGGLWAAHDGFLVHAADFARFCEEVWHLRRNRTGRAILHSYGEAELNLSIACSEPADSLDVGYELTRWTAHDGRRFRRSQVGEAHLSPGQAAEVMEQLIDLQVDFSPGERFG